MYTYSDVFVTVPLERAYTMIVLLLLLLTVAGTRLNPSRCKDISEYNKYAPELTEVQRFSSVAASARGPTTPAKDPRFKKM